MTTTMPALSTEMLGDVCVITFDLPGESVNKFTSSVKDEFNALLQRLDTDMSVKAAVLISGKAENFIAGADIEEFVALQDGGASTFERLSLEGQLMVDRLERMRVPVVAAINGACLGGGLEAALACAYRIASEHPKTVLGLPEVQIGLIPGAGGTQRLPRTVGLAVALDMILTGKNVRAKKAWQQGLVDELVHPAILRDIAVKRAREFAAGARRKQIGREAKTGAMGALLESNPIGRGVIFRKAREGVMEKTHGNYPAPLAAIEAVQAGYSGSRESGFATEARLFGEMAATNVSKQLIYIFFATTALKKDSGTDVPATAMPVKKIGILGSGFMGAGIASVAVPAGTQVRMKDVKPEYVAKGLKALREVIGERYKRKQITKVQFDDLMSLVSTTTDYSGFASADLVIEAVLEQLDVKHNVLREVEHVMPEDGIFASNTSTIPIGDIAAASARPDRVIGMHFFSPVHKMPLLEVIVTPQTDPDVTATVVSYGKQLGKTVIVVHDGPGFYANRILSPYVNEAGRLLDEGAPIEEIDKAIVEFGFPVGPIMLIDEVGIDIAAHAGGIMSAAFPERMEPSRSLQAVIADKRYGRKNKRGFYTYDVEGKKGGVDATVYDLLPTGRNRASFSADEIQTRCVMAMLNEAARCLEDGIIRSPRDGDIGAVFGIGFPPFRGGPFRYMDTLGIDSVVHTLEDLNGRFPPRFTPADILVDMAKRKAKFHQDD